jgi:hypothetical protein
MAVTSETHFRVIVGQHCKIFQNSTQITRLVETTLNAEPSIGFIVQCPIPTLFTRRNVRPGGQTPMALRRLDAQTGNVAPSSNGNTTT